MRALAHVGIIALVDEATGYQRDRAADALAHILEEFIAKELKPWVKTFPDEFYEQLFKLRGLTYPSDGVARPQYFGHLTNDIIYKRLAPGVLEELKRTIPKDDEGRRKHQYHRKLTENLGHPKLREHLSAAIAVMKLSDDYDDFIEKLNRTHPKYNETIEMDLNSDDGKGLQGFLPAFGGRFLGNVGPFLRVELCRTSCATAPPETDGSLVLAILSQSLFFLASRNPSGFDGIADHVGRAALAFGAFRHWAVSEVRR